jgi:hypothetical protein
MGSLIMGSGNGGSPSNLISAANSIMMSDKSYLAKKRDPTGKITSVYDESTNLQQQ